MLNTSISAVLAARTTKTLDLSTPADSLSYTRTYSWADGTGANQANRVFHDQRTVGSGANDDLDVAGGLVNAFGETITLTKLKAVYIENTHATLSLRLGAAGTNPISSLFAATNDILIIPAMGSVLLIAPDTTGYAVTAGSADVLRVANPGGSAVTYKIVLVGVA